MVTANELLSICEFRPSDRPPPTPQHNPPPPKEEPKKAPKKSRYATAIPASGPPAHEAIVKWLEAGNKSVGKTPEKEKEDLADPYILWWKKGGKYYKVQGGKKSAGGTSTAFCFIDFYGNIYMPAGRDAPALGVRATIYSFDPDKLDWNQSWYVI